MDTTMAFHESETGYFELAKVVRLNEEIKRVMRISSEVDMAALNAMLMARRADGGAAGFTVVSAELRRFGNRLGQDMASLVELVHDLVGQVATLRKRARMQRHFERASAMGERTRTLLAALSLRQDAGMVEARERIAADKAGLRVQVQRALNNCDTGRSLSRNAAIEAAYAGAMASTLTQVSRQAGEAVEEVAATLASLEIALSEAA